MLRKSKVMAAGAAALLATTAMAQPVAAQAYGGGYAQGGYYDNAPYPNDPYYGDGYGEDYYGGAYGDPYSDPAYDQYGTAYGEGGYGYDADAAQRDQAAQAWRDRYNPGYGAYGQPGYQQPYNQPAYGYDQQYQYEYAAWRRECERQRSNNQVGGLVFGAIAGGLFGNVVSSRRNRGGATAAGAIAGGALGLALSSNLNCDDGYYAHQAYYGGFEAGHPHRTYRWRNPRSGSYGALRVGEYYRDPRGQRCATYSQTIWVRGRPEEARGYACRRYDGTWELLS